MAFLYSKLSRKMLLSFILIWSVAAFWFLNTTFLAQTVISCLGIISLFFIWYETAALFLLIVIAFAASYAFYGFFIYFNTPVWLIMIAILLVFGYLFTYMEQRTGILGNKRLIYLILFALIILEVFLALSYFLISPLSQSLIIATTAYVFVGFCYSVLAQRETQLNAYLLFALIVIASVFLSSSWSY